mmetsp:Transcript_5728/g.12457  ORF Transcript_5728/g.12457 Transcript_5728/m.12457 type:complete len:347 (-) Transcript_5728:542-1582(-)
MRRVPGTSPMFGFSRHPSPTDRSIGGHSSSTRHGAVIHDGAAPIGNPHGFFEGDLLLLSALGVQPPRFLPVLGPTNSIPNALVVDVSVNLDGSVEELEFAPTFSLAGAEVALKGSAGVVVITAEALNDIVVPGADVHVTIGKVAPSLSGALAAPILPSVNIAVGIPPSSGSVHPIELPISNVFGPIGKVQRTLSVHHAVPEHPVVLVPILPPEGTVTVPLSRLVVRAAVLDVDLGGVADVGRRWEVGFHVGHNEQLRVWDRTVVSHLRLCCCSDSSRRRLSHDDIRTARTGVDGGNGCGCHIGQTRTQEGCRRCSPKAAETSPAAAATTDPGAPEALSPQYLPLDR